MSLESLKVVLFNIVFDLIEILIKLLKCNFFGAKVSRSSQNLRIILIWWAYLNVCLCFGCIDILNSKQSAKRYERIFQEILRRSGYFTTAKRSFLAALFRIAKNKSNL